MFFLAPRPLIDKPQRGSPRMFSPDWVERYFSRARPWQIVAIWVPISTALACVSLRASGAVTGLATVALGIFTWSFLEYVLHRFLFHFKPDPRSEFQRDLSWLIHGVHHDYPWDADRLVMPPFATAVVIAVLFPFIWPLRGMLTVGGVWGLWSGLIAGYVAYDLVHYDLHHGTARTAFGRFMRRYHARHHFASHATGFGITTPLWDVVFRTVHRRDPASVARRERARAALSDASGAVDTTGTDSCDEGNLHDGHQAG